MRGEGDGMTAEGRGHPDGERRKRRVETDRVFHNIVRSSFDLVVDPAQVFSDDADSDELDAAKEENKRDQRRETGLRDLEAEQSLDDEEKAYCEAHARDQRAGVGQKSQWKVRETENAVERIRHKLAKCDNGATGGAFLAVVKNGRPRKADPAS